MPGKHSPLARTFQESPHISSEVPTWHEFQQSIKALKKQSAGMDHVPPHLLAHLLEATQWILFQHIQQVWQLGSLPTSRMDTRISLLYKKGNPSGAGNYCAITVSC